MSQLKLFVWDNPYRIPFGGTVCFAVAESVEAAKAQLKVSAGYYAGMESQTPQEKLGDPDRVLDLPAGEWHSWSE